MPISRRLFLGGVAGIGAATLAGCSGAADPGGSNGSGSSSTLQWWDHFGGLSDLHAEWATAQSAALGLTIEYSYHEVAKLPEALQLANQAQDLPDIFSNVVGMPLAGLVDGGWLHPIDVPEDVRASLPAGTLVEGVSMLKGEVYGVPMMTSRQYHACSWFNKDVIADVGIDGKPQGYQDFMDALGAVAKHGTYSPLVLALGDANRMQSQVDDWAQSGGFPGFLGVRYDTGEYNYDHDAYVDIIELLKEISDRGWLAPGSNQFEVVDARTRFGTGEIAYFINGPYAAGSIRNFLPDFLDKIDVAQQLTPDGSPIEVYRGAPGPVWFMASNTEHPEQASALISSFLSDEYQLDLMSGMDQPALNLDLVEQADVIEPFRWLVEDYKRAVHIAPEPVVRNPDVAQALANFTPVTPHLGNIVQGYIGGQISDLRAELRSLNGSFAAARDAAIEAAADQGVTVDADDWAFPDWKPGQDYTYA